MTNEPPASASAPIQAPPATAAGTPAGATPGPGSPAQTTGTSGVPAAAQSTRNDATVNYEVDRTIDHVKHEPGVLQRLSVAVVVNYRDKDGKPAPLGNDEMANINALVKQAMGYSAERGDTLSVVNNEFTDREPAPKPWEDPTYRNLALQILKGFLALLALLFVWRSVLRPVIQGFASAQVERAKNEVHLETLREQRRQDELRASEINRHEENLSTARTLAQSDPRAVAMVLRSWMDSKNAKS